jgi:hypothetical protein
MINGLVEELRKLLEKTRSIDGLAKALCELLREEIKKAHREIQCGNVKISISPIPPIIGPRKFNYSCRIEHNAMETCIEVDEEGNVWSCDKAKGRMRRVSSIPEWARKEIERGRNEIRKYIEELEASEGRLKAVLATINLLT